MQEASSKVGKRVQTVAVIRTMAQIDATDGTVSNPVAVSIPRGCYGEVIHALEGQRMFRNGMTITTHLIAIRFTESDRSVIDWFSKDKYRDSIEELECSMNDRAHCVLVSF